jgi:esterase/lipase
LNADLLLQKVPAFAKQLEFKHGSENWKYVVEKTARMMIRLSNHPLLNKETFQKISATTLITIGNNDDMVSVEESEIATKQMPKAAFKILNETPHPIEKVNMEMLSKEIIDFID